MATLTLRALWVTNLATGGQVSAPSGRGRDESYEQAVEVRTYANGRRRSIGQAGEVGTFGFTLLRLVRADVETLRLWVGDLVQVRDNKGRRLFGVYAAVPVTEYMDPRYNVGIKLTAVTYTEGV